MKGKSVSGQTLYRRMYVDIPAGIADRLKVQAAQGHTTIRKLVEKALCAEITPPNPEHRSPEKGKKNGKKRPESR